MAAQPRRKHLSACLPPGWWNALLFLAVLAVYILTLNPSLFRNDSPETITACVTLGVSHPPGYPLHTLLGHIFSWIPIGNPAMTLNFFSAILGALGVCLLGANLWLLMGNSERTYPLTATLAGTLAFAFSKSYWSASLAAKGGIYVLQVDLELVFFYFLQLHFLDASKTSKTEGGTKKPIGWLAFLLTLGLANHWPTQFLTLPALGTLAFGQSDSRNRAHFKLTPKSMVQTLTFALLVFSLYLYLPLRANQFPALNFGSPLNCSRFLSCLLRADYSKVETMVSAGPEKFSVLSAKSLYLSNHFLNEFNGLFLILTILGLWGLLRKGLERLVLFLLILILTTLVANVFYLRVIPVEFWHMDDHTMSLNWILGILGGYGIGEALEWLKALHFFKTRMVTQRVLFLLFATALPLLLIFKHRDMDDQSREFLYWGYGTTALESMDLNAEYFAESDYDYFSILYLREVEHRRPDITMKMTTFLTEADWNSLARMVSSGSSSPEHPIYCGFPNGDFIGGYLKRYQNVHFEPVGTVVRFMPPSNITKSKPFTKPLADLWQKYLAPYHYTVNSMNGLLFDLCAHPYINMANYLGLRSDTSGEEKYYSLGVRLIQEPKFQAQTWEKLGDLEIESKEETQAIVDYLQAANKYRLMGMTSEEIECLQKENSIDPNNFLTSWWLSK